MFSSLLLNINADVFCCGHAKISLDYDFGLCRIKQVYTSL